MWLGSINEIISFFVTRARLSNAINSNIYALGEGILIVYFLYKHKLFEGKKKIFYAAIIFLSAFWLIDKFFIASINEFSSYFSIGASFTYVLMSINMINKLFLVGSKVLLQNAVFLICIGFVVFFTYALLVEVFWFYGLNSSSQFRLRVYRILTYINLGTNLIYAIALLWIPRKREYMLL